jgi:hypothetical protein
METDFVKTLDAPVNPYPLRFSISHVYRSAIPVVVAAVEVVSNLKNWCSRKINLVHSQRKIRVVELPVYVRPKIRRRLFNEGIHTPKRGVNAGYVALESSKIPYLAKQLA